MATTSLAALRASALRRIPRAIPCRTIATSALRLSKGMAPEAAPSEMSVGELQGAKFRVEPLRRTGEDDNTKRARLVCKFFFSSLRSCVGLRVLSGLRSRVALCSLGSRFDSSLGFTHDTLISINAA